MGARREGGRHQGRVAIRSLRRCGDCGIGAERPGEFELDGERETGRRRHRQIALTGRARAAGALNAAAVAFRSWGPIDRSPVWAARRTTRIRLLRS